ncbi:MAG TPA: SpoIID/LytB domain-containing protein [Actinomycetota bacterium]|nr:SpoIID/LytB domain-containing protein [Actinomycetota bacterium]
MRRALALAVLLALVAPAPAAVAGAARLDRQQAREKEFRFFGSGFGHGLGMSQWGAYGLARKGWQAPRILTHFYSGTRVGAWTGSPATLRIGLVQGQGSVRLEAQEGEVQIRLGNQKDGELVATVPHGQTWRVRVVNDQYRILDASGTVVANAGNESTPVFAVFQPAGSRVRVPEAGHTYNRGWIEFGLYNCGNGCRMRLVLEIPPEEYLYGLSEVPSSWPAAALRAQAVAARTYAFTKAAASQHRPVCDCALYASTQDQVYAGWDKEGGLAGERWVAAVNRTADKVVRSSGTTIQAFYMSSSGGFTENNENVWGGTPISYLRGVCDPGDYTSANPSATWEVRLDARTITGKLSLGIGVVTGFGSVQRGVSGRILSAVVRGANGTATVAGSTLRSALGLRDHRVWIDRNRQIVGEIRTKYDELGCSPGLPTSRRVAVAGGSRQAFQRGTIFHKVGPGAHLLRNPVLAFYLSKGGPAGSLGFPTTDVRTLANGNLRARFENGVITCSNTSCRRT